MPMATSQTPIRPPYGDIFFIDTPYLDRATEQLYQEQRARAQKQEQENKFLDASLQKELGKVRSVDTPDLINKYNQYKDITKRLQFDKKIQNDPFRRNGLQQEAQMALADYMQTAKKSSELNEQGKQLITERMKKPDLFADDFGELVNVFQNTPLSQGGKIRLGEEDIDLFNPDTYRYKGADIDFQKILQSAIGTPRTVFSMEEPVGKEGIQSKITPFQFGNTPAQVKSSLLGAMAERGTARSAAALWDQLPDEELNRVIKEYNAISPDKLKRMGVPERQNLMPAKSANKAENYASYVAMKYAIENEPKAGPPQFRTNVEAAEQLRQRHRKEMAAISRGNQEAVIRLRKKLGGASGEEQDQWLEGFMGHLETTAKEKGAFRHKAKSGEEFDTYELDVSPSIIKALGFTEKTRPDALRMTPTGDVLYLTYKRDKKGNIIQKGGKYATDAEFSGKFTRPEFKALVGKELLGIKETNKALTEEDFTGEEDAIQELRSKYNY